MTVRDVLVGLKDQYQDAEVKIRVTLPDLRHPENGMYDCDETVEFLGEIESITYDHLTHTVVVDVTDLKEV